MATIIGPKGLVEAASFFANKLGIESHDFTLIIERKKLEQGIRGLCLYDPEEREFTIELERRNTSSRHINIYSVLAHEMVHVKQYVKNELVDFHSSLVLWNGKLMPSDMYWDAPWEIEAYGLQQGLYERWVMEKECHHHTQKN